MSVPGRSSWGQRIHDEYGADRDCVGKNKIDLSALRAPRRRVLLRADCWATLIDVAAGELWPPMTSTEDPSMVGSAA